MVQYMKVRNNIVDKIYSIVVDNNLNHYLMRIENNIEDNIVDLDDDDKNQLFESNETFI